MPRLASPRRTAPHRDALCCAAGFQIGAKRLRVSHKKDNSVPGGFGPGGSGGGYGYGGGGGGGSYSPPGSYGSYSPPGSYPGR